MRATLNTAYRIMRGVMPEFIDAMYHADPADGRPWVHVLLRAPEQLEAEDKSELIAAVERDARKQFPEAEVTGYYVLLTRLIESVLADQWKALVVAGVTIFIMMIAAIRDLRLTLVTFVPNMVPSLVLFGAMGWLGLKVNMGAAMIAAVSVGLSVDSSVHYTMFYQRARRRGLSTDDALARAQDTVGRAAVFSTLALVVGFATLCVSDFVPTIYFGVLVSLSMVGGLVGNLLVLPVLIRAVEPNTAANIAAEAHIAS
jgi:predicted RND superfamily exporter protein